MTLQAYELLHGGMDADNQVAIIRNAFREIVKEIIDLKSDHEDVTVKFEAANTDTRVEHDLGVTTTHWHVVDQTTAATITRSTKNPDSRGLWLRSTVANIEVDVRIYKD